MTDVTEGPLEALLDDWLDGLSDELPEGPPADQEQADRLLGALRGVRRRATEVDALVEARKSALDAWATGQQDQLLAREQYLLLMLESWTQGEHERTGRKTWKLPAGELKVRPRRTSAVALPMTEAQVDQIEALVPAAVVHEARVLPSAVKAVTLPGDVVADIPAPPGYESRQAVIQTTDPEHGTVKFVVPQIILQVPVSGRQGRQFSAVTK